MIPILNELMKRLVKERDTGATTYDKSFLQTEPGEDDDESLDVADMHNILGFLN